MRNWSTENTWRDQKIHRELIEEHEIENPSVPLADSVRISLQEIKTRTQSGYVRYTLGPVAKVVFLVGVSRAEITVSKDEVIQIMTVQAAKLLV